MVCALIFGGAGFIGSQLAKTLVRRGWTVAIFDNFSTGKNLNVIKNGSKIKVFTGDIRNYASVERCIQCVHPKYIFHLAAIHYIPECLKHPQKTWAVNVNGTKNVLKASSHLVPRPRFLFISSAAVYKNSNKPLSENYPLEPQEIYGKSKMEGELATRLVGRNSGLPYIIIRLFNVYGPDDTVPHVIPNIMRQLRTTDTIALGDTKPKRDFIFLNDVTEGLIAALLQGKENETYNLGTGKEYSIDFLVKAIRHLTGKRIHVKKTIKKDFLRTNDRLHLRANIRKIRRDTGWESRVNIYQGLKDMLKKEGHRP